MLTMNHELGHGYRMIEAGGSIIGITYNMPPPFNNEFSYISLNYPENLYQTARPYDKPWRL